MSVFAESSQGKDGSPGAASWSDGHSASIMIYWFVTSIWHYNYGSILKKVKKFYGEQAYT